MSRAAQPDNTGTISRNSFWYAIDASAATIVMLLASVPVARIMGPEILGHYIYLVFLTGIAQRLANLGIPATACKYMAEFIGAGQEDVAHGIYRITLRQQAQVAAVVTAIGCLIAVLFAESGYKGTSCLVVLSIWPNMVNTIPAQANVAREHLRGNIPASFVSFASYILLVILALTMDWGLPGLASATALSRGLEAAVRYWSVERWMSAVAVGAVPVEVRRRMVTFSRSNLILLALGLIVWDRSEIVFLKQFRAVQEVAFYSLAFSIVNQLMMVPRAFSGSIGITMFAQYGRDSRGLQTLLENATRYVALLAVPLFLGLAAVAAPLIQLVYGDRYAAVIPVLWVMSMFAIPRAFQLHTENVLQAIEHQGFMVKWLTASAVVNLVLDLVLIPSHGAVGAAVASGVAQGVAVGGLWVKAGRTLQIRLQAGYLLKIVVCGVAMVAAVLPLGWLLPPALALFAALLIGSLAFGLALRCVRGLRREDGLRLTLLLRRIPTAGRALAEQAVRFVVPALAQVPPVRDP